MFSIIIYLIGSIELAFGLVLMINNPLEMGIYIGILFFAGAAKDFCLGFILDKTSSNNRFIKFMLDEHLDQNNSSKRN